MVRQQLWTNERDLLLGRYSALPAVIIRALDSNRGSRFRLWLRRPATLSEPPGPISNFFVDFPSASSNPDDVRGEFVGLAIIPSYTKHLIETDAVPPIFALDAAHMSGTVSVGTMITAVSQIAGRIIPLFIALTAINESEEAYNFLLDFAAEDRDIKEHLEECVCFMDRWATEEGETFRLHSSFLCMRALPSHPHSLFLCV